MNNYQAMEAFEVFVGALRTNSGRQPDGRGTLHMEDRDYSFTEQGIATIARINESNRVVARAHQGASVMCWGEDPTNIVVDVAEQVDLLQTTACREILHRPAAFCWFLKRNIDLTCRVFGAPPEDFEGGGPLAAISWVWLEDGGGLLCCAWGGSQDSKFIAPIMPVIIAPGSPLIEIGTDGQVQERLHLLRFVVAAQAFLRTRLPAIQRQQVDRAVRRRLERDGWSGDSVIEVVALRQREQPSRNQCEGRVEWSHRWLVRSHLRQQWYPAKGLHLPVVVPAYVKGPTDRPLKPTREQVFAVVR